MRKSTLDNQEKTAKKPNRLITEKSPYLLQHAYNPVNWYPWSDEAFEKASTEDKPIFLSIGYSTCHWCHVMEKESFEDSEVAELMNDTFISIKVDREERPDIDDLYMTVCQAITGGGGWPLSIIMTPEKKPFFAGTYIPKTPRFNQPGLLKLTRAIRHMWKSQRNDLLNSADQVTQLLQSVNVPSPGDQLDLDVLEKTYTQLSSRYDPGFGGFGTAPKFPEPHILMFLIRYWHRTNDPGVLEKVKHTLDYMRRGGVFDHIGYGFHRYSTDKYWLVPHFEKMLYDQALIAMAYIETYQATGNDYFKQTAEEIFSYVLRDLTSPEGGFYSAEDADSEGEEGKYYVWNINQLKKALNNNELDFTITVFNIEEYGNFIEPTSRKKKGDNILHMIKSKNQLIKDLGMPKEEFNKQLGNIRNKLFKLRDKRTHPHKDDKILTDWNGLMIAALAKGAQAFDDKKYLLAAEKAVNFISNNLMTKAGRLLHRYRDGEAAVKGFLNDYSFFVWGLIELYETTFQKKYLDLAIDLNKKMLDYFWDFQNGGLFLTSNDSEELLIRKKQIYDGALPSGNSVAFYNLMRLSRLAKDYTFEEKASELIRAISSEAGRTPASHTLLMVGLDFAVGPSFEVLIHGKPGARDTKEMLRALRTNFIPNKIVHLNKLEMRSKAGIGDDALFNLPDPGKSVTESLIETHEKNKTLAYICVNYSCQKPTSDIQEMLEQLGVRKIN